MDFFKKHNQWIIVVALGVSLLWVATSITMFFADYGRLHHAGYLPGPRAWHTVHTGRPMSAQDIDRIATWMTFAFVNRVFDLPPSYLKDALKVSDAAYPDLTITSAAKKMGVPASTLLVEIKNSLVERRSLPAATSTP